ncbi:penicillin acylase family protein [Actinoplanes lutulentus]|uniref:penicillin acylase family protein n=1 Tax=Actinoplanes lutulentus TaxID=1287878 RepID=UPI0015EB3706
MQRLAGILLDAKFGDIHTDARGGQRIPIHGGRGEAGVFNVITNPLVPGVGYPQVVHGSVVRHGRRARPARPARPAGRQILTYSQSTNPNSPWYADQTRLYSGKGWDTAGRSRPGGRGTGVGRRRRRSGTAGSRGRRRRR